MVSAGLRAEMNAGCYKFLEEFQDSSSVSEGLWRMKRKQFSTKKREKTFC